MIGPMATPYTYRDCLARVPGKDTTWHYRFKWKGRLFQGTTGLSKRADALIWLRRYRDNISKAPMGMAEVPSVLMAWESWKASASIKKSEAHVDRAERAVEKHILPVCGQLPVDQVDDDVVDLIIKTYMDNPSNSTRRKDKEGNELDPKGRTRDGANTVLAYLKMIIRPLIKKGFIVALPYETKLMDVQEKVRPYLPMESVPAFLAAVDRTGNLHQQISVRAMLYMGLREDEALGMRWEWFGGDLDTYTPGKTKGKEAVILPVHPELRELIRQQKSLSQWVLPAEDGEPHRAQFSTKAIKRGGKVLGLALSPHRMRTTVATLMARAGVPTTTIQRQLRHKDINTTLRYIQVGLNDLEEALKTTWGAG